MSIILALSFVLIAFTGPDSSSALAWPPIVALTIVFLTHRAALGLFIGSIVGCLSLANGNPLLALSQWFIEHAWPTFFGSWKLGDPLNSLPAKWNLWHLGAITFTLLLGAFAAVLERGRALQRIIQKKGTKQSQTQRRFLLSVFGMGLLCFFDGLANSLMIGRVARNIADRLRISRAALAYLVDTTSSAVACIAFISTWIAVQLSLIQDGASSLGLDKPAYLLFLSSIPRNYYCLFALGMAFLTIWRGWWIGPMRRAPSNSNQITCEENEDATPAKLHTALVPMCVLLLSILLLYYFLHPFFPPSDGSVPPRFPITLDSIQLALGSNAGPAAFILGSGIALLSALILFPRHRRSELASAVGRGTFQLLPALLVLITAWIFGSVIQEQGTAELLAEELGDRVSLALFPGAVFLAACLISFITGSSWGTMGLLMPLVLPAIGTMAEAQELLPTSIEHITPSVIAAVFGGAVFGDHCSPFSDTTIISSLACGISTPHHTITQLPYALITATTALVTGYLLEALGLSPWLALLIGFLTLVGITSLPPARRASTQN